MLGTVLELGLEPDALGDVPAVEDEPAWWRLTVDSTFIHSPVPEAKRHSMRVVGSSAGAAARKRRTSCTTLPRSSGWMRAASSVPTSSSASRPYTPAAAGLT